MNICELGEAYMLKRGKRLGKSFVVTQTALIEIHMAYQAGAVKVMNLVNSIVTDYDESPTIRLDSIKQMLDELGAMNTPEVVKAMKKKK